MRNEEMIETLKRHSEVIASLSYKHGDSNIFESMLREMEEIHICCIQSEDISLEVCNAAICVLNDIGNIIKFEMIDDEVMYTHWKTIYRNDVAGLTEELM